MRTQHHGFVICFANCLALIGYGIWVGTSNVEARYAAVFLNCASCPEKLDLIASDISGVRGHG